MSRSPMRIELGEFNNADFQRGAPRLVEMAWLLVKVIFFINPLPVPSRVRCRLLRLFGAQIGSGVVIRSGVNISFPWRFRCGDNVWIGEGVTILSLAKVQLGSNVCVSQQSFLCTGSHDFGKRSFDLIASPIKVGDHTWLSARTFVSPGVTIGAGTMCLPCTVVSSDLGEAIVAGGVPARELRCLK
ncbi:WcaF family extracellular polysaccharide biosynthesis acetyltransferase [Congregibacter variabilis]|uniref:WcaF family extracellular polysaccharide biosynthesis acetyltransferase n=1 Tax=Congregibacter variabilis TaxID=3081200 RepID=UPI003890545C